MTQTSLGVAFVQDQLMSDFVRRAFTGCGCEVAICNRLEDDSLVLQPTVRLIVVELTADDLDSACCTVRRWRDTADHLLAPVVAYYRAQRGTPGIPIEPLKRAGFARIVLHGYDDLSRALAATMTAHTLAHAQASAERLCVTDLPPELQEFARHILTSMPFVCSVEAAAARMRSHRRTLERRCYAARVLPPASLTEWLRLATAAALVDSLHDDRLPSRSKVWQHVGVSSARALTGLSERLLGVRLDSMQPGAAFALVRYCFRQAAACVATTARPDPPSARRETLRTYGTTKAL